MKPDWKDAPDWANWLAMDDYGTWYWHEEKPFWRYTEWVSDGAMMAASRPESGGATLEARP